MKSIQTTGSIAVAYYQENVNNPWQNTELGNSVGSSQKSIVISRQTVLSHYASYNVKHHTISVANGEVKYVTITASLSLTHGCLICSRTWPRPCRQTCICTWRRRVCLCRVGRWGRAVWGRSTPCRPAGGSWGVVGPGWQRGWTATGSHWWAHSSGPHTGKPEEVKQNMWHQCENVLYGRTTRTILDNLFSQVCDSFL